MDLIKYDSNSKLFSIDIFDSIIRDLLFFSNSDSPISGGTTKIVVNIMNGSSKKLENDPSIIWSKMQIEKPKDNEYVDLEAGYYPSYYSLDSKQKYLYLKWLQNISKPTAKSFLIILLYCLERNITMGNYIPAMEAIAYLRKFHKDEVFLFYSLSSFVGGAYYWNQIHMLNEIEYNKEIGYYWYNSDLLYMYNNKICIEANDFIKILLSIRCSTYTYFKDKREKYSRHYAICIKDAFNKNWITLSDLIEESSIEINKQMCFINYRIDDLARNVLLPDIFNNASLRLNCKKIHKMVMNKMKLY